MTVSIHRPGRRRVAPEIRRRCRFCCSIVRAASVLRCMDDDLEGEVDDGTVDIIDRMEACEPPRSPAEAEARKPWKPLFRIFRELEHEHLVELIVGLSDEVYLRLRAGLPARNAEEAAVWAASKRLRVLDEALDADIEPMEPLPGCDERLIMKWRVRQMAERSMRGRAPWRRPFTVQDDLRSWRHDGRAGGSVRRSRSCPRRDPRSTRLLHLGTF
jgi:hypothetical protein